MKLQTNGNVQTKQRFHSSRSFVAMHVERGKSTRRANRQNLPSADHLSAEAKLRTADSSSKISQTTRNICDRTYKSKYPKMVSKRLSKVTKQITKKKGKNPNLHEGSRDTQRLQSAAARDDKLNRLTSLREKQNRHYCMINVPEDLFTPSPLIQKNSDANKVISVIHNRA
jgi:hypothetical protein